LDIYYSEEGEGREGENRMITLYLFTAFGIFAWGEYPTYDVCRDVQVELVEWFSSGNGQDLFSIDCIALGEINGA